MLDIRFVRENPDLVKENIRKKFQNAKLPLVDEAIALDAERRQAIADGEALKAERNKLSKANGPLFGQLKKCTDEAKKAELQAQIDANNAAVGVILIPDNDSFRDKLINPANCDFKRFPKFGLCRR